MRRLVLVLAVLIPVAVVGAQPSSAAKKKPSCSVKGSKTVVKSKSARVYTRAVNRGDTIARLYGCLNSAGKKTLLDTSSDDGLATSVAFGQVKLSGRYVAWEHVVTDFSCRAACPPDYDPTTEQIGLADLRLRTKTGFFGNARDGSLKVDSRGTVSWIDEATGEPRSQSFR
jgi:hypothetical protein